MLLEAYQNRSSEMLISTAAVAASAATHVQHLFRKGSSCLTGEGSCLPEQAFISDLPPRLQFRSCLAANTSQTLKVRGVMPYLVHGQMKPC